MSLEHATTAEIAKILKISQRQARRLVNNNDPRLQYVDRGYFLKCSRRRLSAEAYNRAANVDAAATSLEQAPRTETLNTGPEVDQLNAIAKRLRRCASDLRALAGELYPE
jgi:hypothetical protein